MKDIASQSDRLISIDREEKSKLKQLHGKQSSMMFMGKQENGFQNTYRMEPTTSKFFADKVGSIIHSVLEEALKNKEYDYATFSKLTLELSDQIKDRVKVYLNLPRHKLVSFVTIGQVMDQGVRVGSRCVWNPAWDHYACSSYNNHSVFAVGVVFAAYFE